MNSGRHSRHPAAVVTLAMAALLVTGGLRSTADVVLFDHTVFPHEDSIVDDASPDATINHTSANYIHNRPDGEGGYWVRRQYYQFDLPTGPWEATNIVFELVRGRGDNGTLTLWTAANTLDDGVTPWTEDNDPSGSGLTWNNQPGQSGETELLSFVSADNTVGVLRDTTWSSSWKLESQALIDYVNSIGPGGTVSFALTSSQMPNDSDYWWFGSAENADSRYWPSLNIHVIPEPGLTTLLLLGGLLLLRRVRG